MQQLFVVIRTRGPAWQDSRPMESQAVNDLLRITRVAPWTVRLGSLEQVETILIGGHP
jgi:hypothetical protein